MIKGEIVAIDARMIEMSGIGTYIQHLMGQGIYDYAFGREEEIRKYDNNVKVIRYEAPIYSPQEQLLFPNEEIKKNGIQLVHFPHYNVPLIYRGNFVVTVHDLTHILLPEFLGSRFKFYYAKVLMNHALKKAKHIFTVSKNSKNDICKIFDIKPDKISITYNAVDRAFQKKSKNDIEYLYNKYNIPRNKMLLLYVGNLKPHKNLERLLQAIASLKDMENYCLILAGKAFTSLKLKDQEKVLGIDKLVIHTGMVSKEELIDLYNLADLFVFPSLYEGFGIPPLEAMACGTPVAAADNSSIPEVVGDAAILFDALNVKSIADAIQKIHNKEIVDELIKKGLERSQLFKWEKTVETVKKEIESII